VIPLQRQQSEYPPNQEMAYESFEIGTKLPEAGQVVRVRTRTHLVEGVERNGGHGTLVRLACLNDDAQGQKAEVIWELDPTMEG
jgi:hypothetical protein